MSLPYQDTLDEAGVTGRILHRQDIYGNGPPVDLVSEEIFAFVDAHCAATVLDVGAGIGPYVKRLAESGREALGIELDPAIVEAGRKIGRNLVVGSATSLPFADGSFETVMLIESLEHFDDPEAAIAEARRVCSRNVVITVPDAGAIPILSKRLVVPWHLLEATHVNFFTTQILEQVLWRHFGNVKSMKLGHFFTVDDIPVYMHAAAVATV
jgi:ubiquinone/menaquinone biosynthesis C-methylase UbiE